MMGYSRLFVLFSVALTSKAFQTQGKKHGTQFPRGAAQNINPSSVSHQLHPSHKFFPRMPSTTQWQSKLHASIALPDSKDRKALLSVVAFIAMDVAFRRLFLAQKIAFPSSLAACSILFATLLALPQTAASTVFNALQPGAQLLAKWIPVFFVPSLVTLPLGDGLGSSTELVKVGAVIIGGFLLSLLTTAYAVVLVRGAATTSALEDLSVGNNDNDAVTAKETTKPALPFSNELFTWLMLTMGLSGVSVVTDGTRRGIFLLATTLNSFVFGSRLLKIKSIVHPLVTCTGLTWLAMQGMTFLCPGTSFISWLQAYKPTAGRVLLFGLGPAVISLATSMYERRKLMRDNLKAVATAILVSTVSGLFGTAFAVRCLRLASPYVRLSLLSRNITSPLAMAIASMLGADVSLAVSMVVVTGLIGANFGGNLLSALGIQDGIARGLAVGSAAHGLGTAAMTQEKEAFPFAAIAMALTATAATVTVSIPFLQKLLIRIALG